MLKRIRNPFAGSEGYNCFGCSPDNPFGLHMQFIETDDAIVADWKFEPQFSGYKDVLHGGIQSTLMDEIASWYVFVKLKTGGVTASMNTRYIKPVQGIGEVIHLTARLKEIKHKLATMEVKLFNAKGVLCAESEVTYYIFPENVARKTLGFPSPALFYYDHSEDQ